ncbi:MAG TPA: SDR family NAD(P)-dependent oxidoreductase [Bacteroidia bacterium]|jgi:benzil reductase ((S)-benzoin forming)|nr:SDR family NAD(P)-dependent oxidoreductase [Bacteroidia bacterium]
MNYYYITGTSRGLGKALAEHYLKEGPDNKVIGISRSQDLSHKNYEHFSIDLSDPDQLKAFRFSPHHDAKRIVLVNNAGVVGMIKPLGHQSADAIIHNIHVNLTAPAVLTNQFMLTYREAAAVKLIVNVSSGAGKNPIAGWAPYCASKAGLDMMCRVVEEEQQTAFGYPFRIFSVSPGVIDTRMQEEIRAASPEDFKRLNDFINYKIENQLAHPEHIARKFAHIIRHADDFKTALLSVKDVSIEP